MAHPAPFAPPVTVAAATAARPSFAAAHASQGAAAVGAAAGSSASPMLDEDAFDLDSLPDDEFEFGMLRGTVRAHRPHLSVCVSCLCRRGLHLTKVRLSICPPDQC